MIASFVSLLRDQQYQNGLLLVTSTNPLWGINFNLTPNEYKLIEHQPLLSCSHDTLLSKFIT